MRKTSTCRLSRLLLGQAVCVLGIGFGVSGNPLWAQESPDEEEIARKLEEDRQAAEARLIEDEQNRQIRESSSELLREFLNDTPNSRRPFDPRADRRQRFVRFRDAVREFESSTQELREAADSAQVSRIARNLEENTNALLDFVKLINKRHPRLNSSEFKDFQRDDFKRETLATGTRILPNLNAVIRNESESTLDILYLVSLSQLELDILRLKWMTRRLH